MVYGKVFADPYLENIVREGEDEAQTNLDFLTRFKIQKGEISSPADHVQQTIVPMNVPAGVA